MKWKTRRILALTLSAAFCVGLLAACGTADTDQDSQTSQEPESSDASSPDGTEETGAAGYYAGMVLAADEGQLTLQRYGRRSERGEPGRRGRLCAGELPALCAARDAGSGR